MKPLTGKPTLILLSAVILSVASVTAQSAVLTVTNTQDSGPGSLRDTIAVAQSGDTIQFDAALNGQTITLTSAELLINKNLTINGPSANQLTVQRSTADGTPAFRIFRLAGTSSFSGVGLTLTGLTIANGNSSEGGGIFIPVYSGSTIVNCVISGNTAPGSSGGGIFRSFGGSVDITNTTISGNSAANGGGIFVSGSMSTLVGPGVLRMTNSTILGNVATEGGGLHNSGTSRITNSTISANSGSRGGGIKNQHHGFVTYLEIANSTLTGNSALEGGGIYSQPSGSVFGAESRNSIIAGNSAAGGPDVRGELISNGFNLFGNNSGVNILSAQASDQIGTPAAPIDPLLGPLQNNGGPTFTHALLLGSPAIDKGESSGSTADQRGFGRRKDIAALANAPGGDGADIGAFESAFATLANISTRLRVQTADNAMIGGFIITGAAQKTLLVRGIGPSLPLSGALADPFIEVYGPSGEFLATNDNWRDATTMPEIIASGLAPANELEPALWGILNPGAYTVVVRGKVARRALACLKSTTWIRRWTPTWVISRPVASSELVTR
jgi:hypothetical protein